MFNDYQKFVKDHGPGVRYLPTPTFYYGLDLGVTTVRLSTRKTELRMTDTLTLCNNLHGWMVQEFKIPKNLLGELGLPATAGDHNEEVVTLSLNRVGPPKKESYRTLAFTVNGKVQEVEVKDQVGDLAFTGPMADKGNPKDVGSPMPGAVDKVREREGWGATCIIFL